MEVVSVNNMPLSKLEPQDELKMTDHRRTNVPFATSNQEVDNLPEVEVLGITPRGSYDADPCKAVKVDMNRTFNVGNHHTYLYDQSNLIIRRGREFEMTITFNHHLDSSTDLLSLEFLIGSHTGTDNGTKIVVYPDHPEKNRKWQGRVVSNYGDVVKVGITPAKDSIVGRFSTYVTVLANERKHRTSQDPSTDFYVLFNAWNSTDAVFMASESDRQEYVLSEDGTIYNGAADNISSRPWHFGQFQKGVLDVCFHILDLSGMPIVYRGDPVKVSRKASAMINSQDDNGCLVGNWSGEYEMGTSPTSWTGSSEIMLRFHSHGPVSYAQCWCFAGVFNTFLRSIGIPGRVITNFGSAHDNTGNLITDIFVDEDWKMDKERTRDSVWNYHCWNEAYMTRPDLPEGYDGWQVVDATPQETSEGLYRCGPYPVIAIKHGILCYPYDARFIFAEVNSDIIFKQCDRYGNCTIVSQNKTHVGQLILTKAVGKDLPEDVTSEYKYSEGSAQNEETMAQAVKFDCKREPVQLPQADVEMEMEKNMNVNMGDSFKVILHFKNLSRDLRTIKATLEGFTESYNNTSRDSIKFVTFEVTLEPNSTKTETVEVLPYEYWVQKLVEKINLKFQATAFVKETKQVATAFRTIIPKCPPLILQVSAEPRMFREMHIAVKYVNTFNFDLENVTLRCEGPGLLKNKIIRLVAPDSIINWQESFVPWQPGRKRIVASLDCAALQLTGSVDIRVTYEE